ncbi:hypothetical protein PAPYR_9410 [Paratrimastix pyriformis]|uniref:F-box domain-containing protein n=1 Tax=Paratrimastix pyriformis TaxID=342808 RepID=A0ABQ8UA37_9EUKA|nr:hypothetical protein PAPYR_9410 [Paratrimastix pyriformis]
MSTPVGKALSNMGTELAFSLSSLPDEILAQFLCASPSIPHHLKLMGVSRRFRDVLSICRVLVMTNPENYSPSPEIDLFQSIQIPNLTFRLPLSCLAILLRSSPWLETLVLDHTSLSCTTKASADTEERQFLTALMAHRNLRVLSMFQAEIPSESVASALLRFMPRSLEVLRLPEKIHHEMRFLVARCPGLHTLTSPESATDLDALFRGLPALRHLAMPSLGQECASITPARIESLYARAYLDPGVLAACAANLRQLSLPFANIPHVRALLGAAAAIGEHLEVLHLTEGRLSDASLTQIIQAATALRVLRLKSCDVITVAGFWDLLSTAPTALPRLQDLRVDSCASIDPAPFCDIIGHFPALRALSLTARMATGELLVVSGAARLETFRLELSGPRRSLEVSLPALKSLRLAGSAYDTVTLRCPALVEADVQVREWSVVGKLELDSCALKTLSRLNLGPQQASGSGDGTFSAVAAKPLTGLTHLRCAHFPEAAWRPLLQAGAPHLTALDDLGIDNPGGFFCRGEACALLAPLAHLRQVTLTVRRRMSRGEGCALLSLPPTVEHVELKMTAAADPDGGGLPFRLSGSGLQRVRLRAMGDLGSFTLDGCAARLAELVVEGSPLLAQLAICPNEPLPALQTLSLAGCVRVPTDPLVDVLRRAEASLKALTLDRCAAVTLEVLALPALLRLSAFSCPGLVILALHCPLMEQCDLSECRRLRTVRLASCGCLEALNLSCCEQLGRVDAPGRARGGFRCRILFSTDCPRLRGLDMCVHREHWSPEPNPHARLVIDWGPRPPPLRWCRRVDCAGDAAESSGSRPARPVVDHACLWGRLLAELTRAARFSNLLVGIAELGDAVSGASSQ